jgi:hypothetical protein
MPHLARGIRRRFARLVAAIAIVSGLSVSPALA